MVINVMNCNKLLEGPDKGHWRVGFGRTLPDPDLRQQLDLSLLTRELRGELALRLCKPY